MGQNAITRRWAPRLRAMGRALAKSPAVEPTVRLLHLSHLLIGPNWERCCDLRHAQAVGGMALDDTFPRDERSKVPILVTRSQANFFREFLFCRKESYRGLGCVAPAPPYGVGRRRNEPKAIKKEAPSGKR